MTTRALFHATLALAWTMVWIGFFLALSVGFWQDWWTKGFYTIVMILASFSGIRHGKLLHQMAMLEEGKVDRDPDARSHRAV